MNHVLPHLQALSVKGLVGGGNSMCKGPEALRTRPDLGDWKVLPHRLLPEAPPCQHRPTDPELPKGSNTTVTAQGTQ